LVLMEQEVHVDYLNVHYYYYEKFYHKERLLL
jgi:hypothetical protein